MRSDLTDLFTSLPFTVLWFFFTTVERIWPLRLSAFQNKCKAEYLKRLEHEKLIEAEKKRIAHMRQQQLESEQFQFFEDQLKKQELARDQKVKENMFMSEQIDGSMLSCISTRQNNSLSPSLSEKVNQSETSVCAGQSPPVNRAFKPVATLSAVQSKCLSLLQCSSASHNLFQNTHRNMSFIVEFILTWRTNVSGVLVYESTIVFSLEMDTYCTLTHMVS